MSPKLSPTRPNSGERNEPDPSSVTRCLAEVRQRRPGAEDRLLDLVYKNLRRMAGQKMRRERLDHTLQPTALSNEVYLKLLRTVREIEWKDSAHFYGICGRMMRNILVDHARRHDVEKRDVELFPGVAITYQRSEGLLSLDRSLDRLARFDPRGATAVELTYFLGFTQKEVALELKLAVRTVKRDLSACLKWLRADMGGNFFDPGNEAARGPAAQGSTASAEPLP